MICQIFKISDPGIFKEFSNSYKIFRDVYDSGLYGLEIRNLLPEPAEEIFKIILEENEVCYRKQPENESTDLFIPGSINQLRKFARKVISAGNEDTGYRLMGVIKNYEDYDKLKYSIGSKEFVFSRAYIMGILNVTPDSFSDGGLFLKREEAVKHGIEMIDSGADIIDIGGESTRPGSDPVVSAEEVNRIIPVIEGILKERPDAVISVDTTKSRVAAKAMETGALIINDISGMTYDPLMLQTAVKYNASVILMHIKGVPKTMQSETSYRNLVREVFDFLVTKSAEAKKAGLKNIIIDPGIGFAKTAEHNFELLKRLEDFKCLGYPVLTGVSRKSFIGNLLQLKINERDTATAITEAAAVINGARILRTHNVKYCSYVTKLTGKIFRYV